MPVARRGEVTDAQWAKLEPLLPPRKPKTGKPNKAHRTILNGIVWKLRTGAPWRELPERSGPWSTVASRFRRWRRAGVWDRILAALQQRADAAGQLDWELQFVDGSVIRAHQHAAGARKKGATKRSVGVKAASARRSLCASRAAASPSRSS